MQKYLSFMLGILAIVLILVACRGDEILTTTQDNQNFIYKSKSVFEKSDIKFPILKYTERINWDKAIVTEGVEYISVEIPLTIDQKLKVSYSGKTVAPIHRLLFRKSKLSDKWDCFYLFIENDNNFDLNDINYNSVKSGFKGSIKIFNKDNILIENLTYEPHKPLYKERNSKTAKNVEVCVWYGWIYEDGTFVPIMLVGCSGGDDFGTGGYIGGGGIGSGGTNTTIRDQPIKDNPCIGSIYLQLTDKNNGIIDQLISKFLDNNSLTDVNLNFFTENSNVAGNTQMASTGNQIFINFNTNYLGSNPTYMAKVIAHEFIHAHLYDELVREAGILTREQAENMNIFQLINQHNSFQTQLASPTGQHNIMANDYLDYMIEVMKKFDALNGYFHSENEYKMLAWAGLGNTPEFESAFAGQNLTDLQNQQNNLIDKKACTK